jgi:hypothetical protein
VRRHAALIVSLLAHVFVAAMSALFYLRLRVAVAEAFSDFGTTVPGLTAIAISDEFLPAAVVVGMLLTIAGIVLPLKRSRRAMLLGAGVCVASFALVFAIIAAYLPLFKPASS